MGSNNLPLLVPEVKQFAASNGCGRSIYDTLYRLQEYTRNIFRKEDDAGLLREEEGQSIEQNTLFQQFLWFWSTMSGIAVEFWTRVPQHKMEDIVKSIQHKLTTGEFLPSNRATKGSRELLKLKMVGKQMEYLHRMEIK